MDFDRPTEDLKLEESGAVITLYSNITTGDFRKIQRTIITEMKVRIDPSNPTESKIQDISGAVAMDEEDVVLECLLVKIVDKEGNNVENMKKFIYDLPVNDGNALYDRINAVSAKSSMEKSRKKK